MTETGGMNDRKQELAIGLASYGWFLDQGPVEYRDDIKGETY
jgi:hypothetical protein